MILIIAIIIIGIFITYIASKKITLKIMYPKLYDEYIQEFSKEYNVDENIIYAIIKNESNFKEDITSNKGAIGLMQIMEETGKEVATSLNLDNIELSDPKNNIQIGTKYFSELYKKYNNVGLSLAAYNAGAGNVDKWIANGIITANGENIENIPFKETNMYVRKVIQTMKIYSELYE